LNDCKSSVLKAISIGRNGTTNLGHPLVKVGPERNST
jgi:hypothetical protein